MNQPLKATQLLVVSACMVGMLTSFSGCQDKNSAKDIEQMKADIEQLKTEYQDLSSKVNSTTVAAAQVEEGGAGPITFTDLNGTPNRHFIEDMGNLGIFDTKDTSFKPLQPVTRGEYVTWLYKAYNALNPPSSQIQLAPTYKVKFTDVSSKDPSFPYIQALANAGYSVGYEDGTFKPNQPITREEMIAIKVGVDYNKQYPPDANGMNFSWHFTDGKDVDNRYTGYINADHGEVGKYGSNIPRAFGSTTLFKPKQAVLRYEAVATLWQIGCCPGLGSPTADQALAALKLPVAKG